jgi:RNA polymerase sigma-70 factor (ECF subfamily)
VDRPELTGGNLTDGDPTGGHLTGGHPTGGHLTGGHPTGAEDRRGSAAALPESAGARTRAESVARASYGRLIALLAAPTGDIALAEDALADAFEAALTTWPVSGVPANPEAWLLTVARNRQRDVWKSAATRTSRPLDPVLEFVAGGTAGDAAFDAKDDDMIDAIPDRRLALLFVCAHPAIDPGVRTALMLQTVLGFEAAQIATAFAVPAPAMAQRLVRAKRRIRDARIPFTVPDADVMPRRLPAVLEAIYGCFAIGSADQGAPADADSLSGEALYLAETLAGLLPTEPETSGLAALICLSLARTEARRDGEGRFVPLGEQDPARWDAALIARGEEHLRRAASLGRMGRYQLEAAIQSVHCSRRVTGAVDLAALRTLHEGLVRIAPTLGALVSLAAVIGELEGPAAGLAALDRIDSPAALRFQPAWATRAHLLSGAGRSQESAAAYERAIALTTDPTVRAYLADQRP